MFRPEGQKASRAGLRMLAIATAGVTAASGAVVAGAVPGATPASAGAVSADPLEVDSLAVPAVEPVATSRSTGRLIVARLPRTATHAYGMVAVIWAHGTAPDGTKVRVRSQVDGAWTEWQALPIDLDEGPSADEEVSGVRDGTVPLWVGDGSGIAVKVTAPGSIRPKRIRVDTIDPGSDPATSASGRVASAGRGPTSPTTFPAMPKVITRAQWGADPSLDDQCWEPIYGSSAKMVFVHHTVNSNDYSRSDGKAIVRAIHAYHTQSRGWCDIGYNFLIDKYGKVYEGRRGGMRRPVRGAHAGDYNLNTVGVSLIGNFEITRPTPAMKRALIRFIGWRLGTSYVNVKGTVRINGTRFDRISGHRDAMSTACPGKYVYRWLPKLRDRVARYLSDYRSPIRARAKDLGRSVTGPVFRGEDRQDGGLQTVFGNGVMFAKAAVGAHWLTGSVLRGYRERGGTHSRFGFPVTDVETTSLSRVRRVVFEHGRMYRVGKRQPDTLWGRVLIRYRKLGGITGRLGVPTSSMMPTGDGRKANFAKGSITWDRDTGRVTVEFS
jgi:uncharacterized protein with LGFP repeats